MSQLEILVCGAGIAGSTLAFWLARAGHKVVMIEKAPEMRNSGLGIDIRGPAVEVIRRMGVESQIRSRTTGEEGLGFVDSNDRTFALFPVDQDNLENSPTSEIEIMRSDLVDILSAAASEQGIQIQLGTSIETLSQDEHKVSVTFNTGKSATFDMVLAADGLGSNSRKLMLGDRNQTAIHSLGMCTAYFSMPRRESDGNLWKWYTASKSRSIHTRPKNEKMSCCYVSIMRDEQTLRDIMKGSISEQKTKLAKVVEGSGWKTERLMADMESAEDFYLQHIAQVKLQSWSVGRCAVVGDAAYCPSPVSGVGTSLAILGAYVLAGEISRHHDHRTAFEAYEGRLRGYVEGKQKLPPGVPGLVFPSTAIGLSVLNWVLWFVAWSGVTKLFGAFGGEGKDNFELPDYKFGVE
jgi:2-polyprenyl-6-methoxyphenol hydroxylase-like FAD-dependent oxidoreductase